MMPTILFRKITLITLFSLITYTANGELNIAPSAEETNPLQAGATAPDFYSLRSRWNSI